MTRAAKALVAGVGAAALALGAGVGVGALASVEANTDWRANLPAPLTDADFFPENPATAALGQLLFYDPILSGNREVSCATCHHPAFGTGDGLSLGIGDGGMGLGTQRVTDPANAPEQRIPRNAMALWNLGAREYHTLFHDGRVEADPTEPQGFRTPLGRDMPEGFSGLLSAQTMFPVLSADEMAGHYSENEISRAVRQGLISGPGGAWDLIARRVAAIPAYAEAFVALYPHIQSPDDIGFADVSNAIADFMAFEFRSDTAPFDAFLRGEGDLPPLAMEGAALFYGEAGCVSCHEGAFQSDHAFHAMGDPQLGPGKGARFETNPRDEGRFRVTGHAEDLYAFRTPALRNVALTAPYGHAGAYADLAAYLRHHADPVAGLSRWSLDQAVLPAMLRDGQPVDDLRALNGGDFAAIAAAVRVEPVTLSDADIAALVAFLDTLTDPVALTGRLGVPETVPSGLTVINPAQ